MAKKQGQPDIGSTAQLEQPSIFDGYGENAFLDARRLVRAGELASRACPGDDDYEAFGALFRAVDGQLELVGTWAEKAREEVIALRTTLERVMNL